MEPEIVSQDLLYYEDIFLGNGTYGEVFKGKYKDKDVAVKQISLRNVNQQMDRENEIMCRLNHPNIVKLLDVENKGKFRLGKLSKSFFYFVCQFSNIMNQFLTNNAFIAQLNV